VTLFRGEVGLEAGLLRPGGLYVLRAPDDLGEGWEVARLEVGHGMVARAGAAVQRRRLRPGSCAIGRGPIVVGRARLV
jgi:hypothetical protein